jgi:hypothetical protein
MKLSADNLLADEIKNSHTSSNSQLSSTNATSTVSNLALPSQSHNINGEFDSPIINHRLSNDHRNISTNLSTSASLLDATTDDAMSGNYLN